MLDLDKIGELVLDLDNNPISTNLAKDFIASHSFESISSNIEGE